MFLLTTELHRVSRSDSQSGSGVNPDSVTQCEHRVTPWLIKTGKEKYLLLAVVLLYWVFSSFSSSAQVRIRLYAGNNTDTVVFSVTAGQYKIKYCPNGTAILEKGQKFTIIKSGEKLVTKTIDDPFRTISDSVLLTGITGYNSFSVTTGKSPQSIRYYSGNLFCKPDLGTILLINNCDTESYVAGVVKAEGGSGRHPEYYKVQALIARTFLYRHMNKHALDGFNLCDNVHCQAFSGITDDSVIVGATLATKGLVIMGKDSLPITATFHSNCGGETLASEDLWLTGHSYLKKVKDPYCTSSRNSRWNKIITVSDWIGYLKKSGMPSAPAQYASLNFNQPARMVSYRTGNFSIPFVQIRTDLGLRSSFFSVKVEGNEVILNGRGYGHGVGLCQEGAMVMASKGFDFRKIIDFYYKGVILENFSTVESQTGFSDQIKK